MTPGLAERHLRELHVDSAIPLEVIAERGYRTVADPTELLRLGFSEGQCLLAKTGCLYPLHGLDGSNGRYAFKPDGGWLDRDGKRHKYMYPLGFGHMLDMPPRCLEQIGDAAVPILFTEGGKKADCGAGLGYCTVNIWGTSAWYRNPRRGGFATIEPLVDWELLRPTLDGRIVYLCYDSDAWRNPNVARELRRLANWLAKQGALVFIVHLPDEPDGGKNGMDDFVARHGAGAFAELVEQAEPWAWGSSRAVRALEAENRRLKRELLALERMRRNPSVSSGALRVGWALADELRVARASRPTGPCEVNREQLAARAGVSAGTVGKYIDEIACVPDSPITKRRQWRTGPDGEAHQVLMIDTRAPDATGADVLEALSTGGMPQKAPHGGKRQPRCPDHPNARLAYRERLLHFTCGCVVEEASAASRDRLKTHDALLLTGDDGADLLPSVVNLLTQDALLVEPIQGVDASPLDGRHQKTSFS